jgi:hypothetical protein
VCLMGHPDITILRQCLPLNKAYLQETHLRFRTVDILSFVRFSEL